MKKMREIKFRAWDASENKMLYQKEVAIALDGSLHLASLYDWYHTFNDNKGHAIDWLKIMQCIGLKDKNGKEIYEGDILRFEDSTLVQVVFVDCSARFAAVPLDTKKHGSAEWTIGGERYEIVGNICEDLELMIVSHTLV